MSTQHLTPYFIKLIILSSARLISNYQSVCTFRHFPRFNIPSKTHFGPLWNLNFWSLIVIFSTKFNSISPWFALWSKVLTLFGIIIHVFQSIFLLKHIFTSPQGLCGKGAIMIHAKLRIDFLLKNTYTTTFSYSIHISRNRFFPSLQADVNPLHLFEHAYLLGQPHSFLFFPLLSR